MAGIIQKRDELGRILVQVKSQSINLTEISD